MKRCVIIFVYFLLVPTLFFRVHAKSIPQDNSSLLRRIFGHCLPISVTFLIGLIGFIFWDRRTVVRVVEDDIKSIEQELKAERLKIATMQVDLKSLQIFQKLFHDIAYGKPVTNELLKQYGV